MIVNSIELNNFRIHKNSNIDFSEELNFLVGGNGQGKTTVLEAIYFVCTTKNFKSASDSEFITYGEDFFQINCLLQSSTNHNIKIVFGNTDKKRVYLKDGKPLNSASEVIGKFPIVLSTPQDQSLTQGYSSERRKFIDSIISQSSDNYLKTLLEYNRTLRQRASLLTTIKEKRNNSLFDELDAWDLKLVTSGVELIKFRFKFVVEFRYFLYESYNRIMGKTEEPEIIYETLVKDQGNIAKEFMNSLKRMRNSEVARGSNLIGPHKDDFIFGINGKNLKIYGSQGQNKTFQTALRFAQFFYLKEKTGKIPVFLLDDVFGVLDAYRAKAISEYIKTVGQAFITVTDLANLSFLGNMNNFSVINIAGGVHSYAEK